MQIHRPYANMAADNYHLILLTKEMNPITRKTVSKLLVTQPSFRAVDQTHAEW